MVQDEHQAPLPTPNLAEDILNAIDAIVFVADSTGNVLYVSPTMERILGYSSAELLGTGWWEIVQSPEPEEVRRARKTRLMMKASGQVPIADAPFPTMLLSKSGEVHWILWQESKGPGDLVIGAGQDMTRLHIAEEDSRQREQDFRAIFAAASDGMLILNSDWVYENANPAACRIFGLKLDEIVGKPHGSLLKSSIDRDELRAEAARQGNITALAQFHRPDGESRDIECWVVANFRPGYHLITLRDVTDRRRLEKQLGQAQKLEAVGRLAGGVAHDFNNMLTAIRGYAELLLKKYPEGDHRRYVEGILNASERAAQTTQQLLAFSRQQVMQPKLLDINEAVKSTLNLVERLIGEDVQLVTSFAPEVDKVKVDPGQLSQILLNLVVNSRDAMPKGGKLIIETRNAKLDAQYVSWHMGVRPGQYVMVSVTDTGIGIDRRHLPHIFDPFFTTKEQGKGTGLGLATVYGIVRQSSGHIWVYSEPGEGSTFKIYFPAASEKDRTAERKKTILVIEDEEATRSLVVEVLLQNGYQVLDAADGVEALSVCETHEGIIDLILTDVGAPTMSGEDLMGYFAVKYPGAAIIHMSGFTRARLSSTNELNEDSNFLDKPFTVVELLEKVRDALKES